LVLAPTREERQYTGMTLVALLLSARAEALTGTSVADALDDQQELAHRRRWLLQSAIAEVARQPKSRALVGVGSRS
jgi:hypothetical protein